jgi:hypothetical protein
MGESPGFKRVREALHTPTAAAARYQIGRSAQHGAKGVTGGNAASAITTDPESLEQVADFFGYAARLDVDQAGVASLGADHG